MIFFCQRYTRVKGIVKRLNKTNTIIMHVGVFDLLIATCCNVAWINLSAVLGVL